MNAILIPSEAITSPEYMALSLADRLFLVDLYIVMNDIERFTIDMTSPQNYRQGRGVNLARRIIRLLESGLLIVDERRKSGARIFRLKHSSPGEFMAAA